MRIELSLAALLLPVLLFAQENVKVMGRIVNEQGEAVEYVQIGVPKHQIGTIGTADGNTKEKYLLRSGVNILGNTGIAVYSLQEGHATGKEVGSVAQTKRPFLVKEISLPVRSNHIPGCVASINIYRIEGEKESFVNLLHKPIYFDVAVSDKPQKYDLQPEETLLLEPGKYFIAFQVVGCDEQARQAFLAKPKEEREFWEMTMDFSIHLKSSYVRDAALGEMQHLPINIGVAVKGLEYQ